MGVCERNWDHGETTGCQWCDVDGFECRVCTGEELAKARAAGIEEGRRQMQDEAIAAVDDLQSSILDEDGDSHLLRREVERTLEAIPVRK